MTKPESPTKLISTGTRQYQKKWSSPSQHVVEKFAIDAKKKDAHDITSYVSTESTCHHRLRKQNFIPCTLFINKNSNKIQICFPARGGDAPAPRGRGGPASARRAGGWGGRRHRLRRARSWHGAVAAPRAGRGV
jgi:hypothetical protein